jgi:Holliday junction resolvase RusA-like endonuclease
MNCLSCPTCTSDMDEIGPDTYFCTSCGCRAAQLNLFEGEGMGSKETNKLFIPILPMGAVRTTQRQKFSDKRYLKYAAYKMKIGLLAREVFKTPLEGPISAHVTFYMPIPDSWSQKKKDSKLGAFHTSKPDIDNLIKGMFDSLNKITWKDDNQVYEVYSQKIYSKDPGIEFELLEAADNGETTKKDGKNRKGKTKGGAC